MEEFHKIFFHQDIKPDNLMVDKNGNIKFIDLGLAVPIVSVNPEVIGTANYNSLEKSLIHHLW